MQKRKLPILPLAILALIACGPDGPIHDSPTAPKLLPPGDRCASTCDLITDSKPFQASRSSPDSTSGALYLGKTTVRGAAGASVTLGLTGEKNLLNILPRDARVLVRVGNEKEQSFAVSALSPAPLAIYRFNSASTVDIRYSLSRGKPASLPDGAVRLTQSVSSAEVVASERWWVRTPKSYSASLSALSSCIVAAAYSNICGIYAYVYPFASGGLGGTFQSNSGTGASRPVWISFTAPGATNLTVTVYDPTWDGNAAVAYDVAGNVLGSVGFAGTGIPGWNVPATQTLPFTDIRSVQLVPANNDYVSYDVSFEGISSPPACASGPLTNYDRVSDPFGQVDTLHVDPHMGRDYAVISGTQFFAPDSGTIVWSSTTGTAGYAIVLRSALPDSRGLLLDTYFMHLQGPATGIHVGSVVHGGQLLGFTDDTGYSTGPHLHFEQNIQASWPGEPDPRTPFPAGHAPRNTVVVPCTF